MGSSKRHKEKERDRESKKRPYKSRSPERPSSRRDRKDKRDRSRSRSKERTRKRARDSHNEDSAPKPSGERLKLKDERQDAHTEVRTSNSGGEISMSIEETNKLRARLGLKPLEVKSEVVTDESANQEGEEKKDVHLVPENLGDKKYLEKLREKIALQKEKRKFSSKLSKVKALAESDSEDDDSAHAWVEKSRKMQEEKKKAEQRAKLLEEMDEEFGIGNIVEEEFKTVVKKAYTSRDLKGMVVQHSKDNFVEGKNVVLTLKDKDILEEEDDVLININMIDDEKAKKNVEVKKKKPGYNAYEEPEYDELGQPIKNKSVLKKYDEEIAAAKATNFRIGSRGEIDMNKEKELMEIRRKLQARNVESLLMPAPNIASEYFTEEEMVKFKKPKKVRKVRKKALKADELQRMIQPGESRTDYGSRSRGRVKRDEYFSQDRSESRQPDDDDMDVDRSSDIEDTEILGPDEDLTGVAVEPDEAELELQFALGKARKLKQKSAFVPPHQQIRSMTSQGDEDDDDGEAGTSKSGICMTATAEFCRALGDIPTYGLSGNREEDAEELMDFNEEVLEDKRKYEDDSKQASMGAWNEVGIEEIPIEIKKEDAPILEDEPDVSVGVAGALTLATKKGYLDKDTKKIVGAPRHSNLEATSYTIEDKSYVEDDKYARRDRYSAGPVTDFKERDAYKPDVKLEYVDDCGRLLTPKEAFRYLSHKFHGKGSGKNKTEKRMKKVQEENLMKQMSSTDTPLGTLSLLQEKQKQTQSPYILLSGGSKALNPSAISKPK